MSAPEPPARAVSPRQVQAHARLVAGLASRDFQLLAGPGCESMAAAIEALAPERFTYHTTVWDKFADGTDKIQIGGYQPQNVIAGSHVLLLCSFHNNDVTLSQFSVMIVLLESFVESLTVVLPFYPVGTMERVTEEGTVATANTYARMFSNLPLGGRPTRLMLYDLHTLQNRFYMSTGVIASLCTTIPSLLPRLSQDAVMCVAFPDDGAAKRFKHMFASAGFSVIVCGKVRHGDERRVTIQEGDAAGKAVCIVDDLVQTGGTLFEAGKALMAAGASQVSAFVAHAVFPQEAWRRFCRGGDRAIFERFYITNSNPTRVAEIPTDDVFKVIDICAKIVHDLDHYST
mmetsp:Transcript_1442/g.3799  ORF Transcript_1442/g.3799 Transcript_1442/m.3799 type:complete len:344 (-) Transcript_1442:362-1393(-)